MLFNPEWNLTFWAIYTPPLEIVFLLFLCLLQKRINADCLEVEAIESEILKDATQLKTTRKRKLDQTIANNFTALPL